MSISLWAQVLELNGHSIQWQSNTITSTEGKLLLLRTHNALAPKEANNWGLQIINSLGNNTYLVKTTKRLQVDKLKYTHWATFESIYKIAPELLEKTGEITIQVKLNKATNAQKMQDWLAKHNATTSKIQQWEKHHAISINIPANKLLDFAQHSDILGITASIVDEPLLEQTRFYVGAGNAIKPLSLGGRELTGANLVVGVGDDAHPFHVDLTDRLNNFNPQNQTAHGYHVATTVAGAGIINPIFTGFAPRANVVTNYFSNIISESENYYQDFGMTLTNNSYGADLNNCNAFGLYSIYSQIIDEQLNNNKKLLHIFAAGNSANRTCSPFPYQYATVAGHYQPTKNVLTVANMGKNESAFSVSSSVGPTKDGRIKPEIAAMGTSLIAGGNNNNYYASTGTSMAAPNVAGAAALLSERYLQLHNSIPDGALIKGLLMSGAKDVGNPGPDFKTGFGLMNLEHSLKTLEENRYFRDSVNTGVSKQWTITVPTNTTLLKVMLYWQDPEGTPGAPKTLVNDLDVTLTSPTNQITLPWILDHTPANVANNATRGVDRLNNVEQITITNPTSGNYTITVTGFDVSIPNQEFYVFYETEDDNLFLKFPQGGEKVVAGNSQNIYWESPFTTGPIDVLLSTDNGNTFAVIGSITNPNTRHLAYTFSSTLNSTTCQIRVLQNGKTVTSGNFTVSQRPTVSLAIAAEQCPGSAKINWTSVPNATAYRIYRKMGAEMVAIATTNNLTYTVNNLPVDELQWLGVAPIFGTLEGQRSVAISRLPNNGNCVGVPNGDLSVKNITPNISGRRYTQSSFTANTPITAEIANLSGTASSAFRVSYRVNNGAWVNTNFNNTIAPGATSNVSLGNYNFSIPNKYTLTVVVSNLAIVDPNQANDTLVQEFYQWANEPLVLNNKLIFDFENNNFNHIGEKLVGIDSIEYLDFNVSTAQGIATSFLNSTLNIAGNRSFSMFNQRNVGGVVANASKNNLIATYNLSIYDTANSEIRLEFDYLLPNRPTIDSLNSVWIRNNENSNWVRLLNYVVDSINRLPQNTSSISLTNIFKDNNWNFTESVQVKWEQYATVPLSTNYYGQGVTLDNITLSMETNDVFIVGTESISNYNCGLSSTAPIKLYVGNGVNRTVYNIAVSYQIDNGAIITELIDSISPKDTITYTFNTPADLSLTKYYTLNSWVYLATDTYRLNDSLLGMSVMNQPIIANFPYLQTFEENDGFFTDDGVTKVFQYGTPNKNNISYAASGTKAWITDTASVYPDRANHSLYSPCFDVSTLANPMLSFSFIYHTEQPSENDSNQLADYAFVEYTHDGFTWQKLGTQGAGYNWYNHQNDVFVGTQNAYWQVASIPIPKDENIFAFRLRFVSDEGGNFDGIAIDDIHIYDLENPIFSGDSLNTPADISLLSNTTTPVLSGNDIVAALNINNNSARNITLQSFKHNTFANPSASQHFLPRSFVTTSPSNYTDTVTHIFYIEDATMKMVREDTECISCYNPKDIYRFGASIYSDAQNPNTENKTLLDNAQTNNYTYIPYNQLQWIPYNNGYYAIVKTLQKGEFWFNGGGPTSKQAIGDATVVLSGTAKALVTADLQWTSFIDSFVTSYHLERLTNDSLPQFETIFTTENGNNNYQYLDVPPHNGKPMTYRLRYTLANTGNRSFYTNSVILDWNEFANQSRIYPNPVTNGKVTIEWNQTDDAPIRWILVDNIGKQVMGSSIDASAFGGKYELDFNQYGKLANGVYIIRLFSKSRTWDYKIAIAE